MVDWGNVVSWTEGELVERFDSDMRDCYGIVTLLGYEFDEVDLLKKVDQRAYHQSFLNWMDSEGINQYKELDNNYAYEDDVQKNTYDTIEELKLARGD